MTKRKTYRTISFILAITVILAAFSVGGYHFVRANDPSKSIVSFTAELSGGAVSDGEHYVWSPESPKANQRISYTVGFSIDGEEALEAGELVLTVPKSVLRDKNGEAADVISLFDSSGNALPSQQSVSDYTGGLSEPECEYYYTDNGGTVSVRNLTELTVPYENRIIVSYDTILPQYYYPEGTSAEEFAPEIQLIKNDTPYQSITKNDLPELMISSENLSATRIFIDAGLLMRGQTDSGAVAEFTNVTFDKTIIPEPISDAEKSFLINSGVSVHDHTYALDADEETMSYLSKKRTGTSPLMAAFVSVRGTSKTKRNFPVGKSDPSAKQTQQASPAAALAIDPPSPELQYPCLYLGTYTTALNYLNGYWSGLGEVNTTGYNQYDAQKLEMTLDKNGNNKYKLELPSTSIKAKGKVYDYYNDADLGGASAMIKAPGVQNTTWEAFYYKFNDALSDYYKEHNMQFYSRFSDTIQDTHPDPNTVYSQSFGITDPLYLGHVANSSNPVRNEDVKYGLFGIDNSYNKDPETGLIIYSKRRTHAIVTDKYTKAWRSVSHRAAYPGIVADHLGENGEILINTTDPSGECEEVPSPFFNEDFLDGNNTFNTAIGKAFDAEFTFDRTEKTINGKRTYIYALAQDRRFFFNPDGTLNTELQKHYSKTSGISKELMPLNYLNNSNEYTNAGYAQRIDVPFILPDDGEKYTMTIKGDDCVWIYLDGQLIIDLGGLNYVYDSDNILGTLNFTNNNATVNYVRTVNGMQQNYTTTFSINDGRRHELTIVQIDNYTGEGCVFVETDLALESVVPEDGAPESSYEIENIISSPEMSDNLSSFVDSLDIKNTVFVDAPHTAGEMNIVPSENVSLFSSYTGNYNDREYYEAEYGWEYTNGEAVLNRLADIDLGRNEIYASLGLVYPEFAEIESNAFQHASYVKTILNDGGNTKDLSGLFNTSVTNYQGQGMYNGSKFLIGTTDDQYKRLQKYSDSKIPSMEYPGDNYGNFAWTNKTLVKSVLKTGKFTLSKQVADFPYEKLFGTDFTFNVYYMNIEDVFGKLPDEYDYYNGEPCITDVITLRDGESITLNVPEGIRCVIEEAETDNYSLVSPDTGRYDFTAAGNVSESCTFVNERTDKYTRQTDADIRIEWVDNNNSLLLRPVSDKYFKPYDTLKTTDKDRSSTLIYIVFRGNDGKWHKLTDAVSESASASIFNAFTDTLDYEISYTGNITYVSVQGLPEYALPYFVKNAGTRLLTEGAQMQYGFMQNKYGAYTVTPLYSSLSAGVQPSGQTITDTLYGTITINKYGADSRGNRTPLSDAEFDLYNTNADAQSGTDPVLHLKTVNGTAKTAPVIVGTYWLVENDVLDNYEPQTAPRKVVFSQADEGIPYVIVNIDNTLSERDVIIAKQVDMTYGNIAEEEYSKQGFDFTAELSGLIPDTEYTVIHSFPDKEDESEAFTAPSDGALTKTFTLKHGETMTFKALPAHCNYRITEGAVSYYCPSYTIEGENGSVIAKAHDEAVKTKAALSTGLETVDRADSSITVTFTNQYRASDFVLPSAGMDDSRHITVLYAIGAIIALGAFILIKRKNRTDDK